MHDREVTKHIGLIGCGGWGRHILRDLLALGCEVTVVARSEATRGRAEEGGATRIVAGTANLAGVDGIVVATPTSDHQRAISEALELGVKVFTEKALTADPVTARRLAHAAPDDLFVMDKWRYHPAVLGLADLIADGTLGPIRNIATRRNGWGNPHDDVDGIWILLPHDLSIVLELLGSLPEPTAASATARGEEFLTLAATLGSDPWVSVEVSTRAVDRNRSVEVHGDLGSATFSNQDYEAIRLRLDGEDDERIVPVDSTMPLYAELEAFVHHLDGGPPPRSSAAEGAEIVEVVAALRELAKVARSGRG